MAEARHFPANWLIGQDFDPNEHLISLKGRDYLNVQNRLLWFIRDQRALIAAGLATSTYVVRTELVEMDRESGWAQFKTFVRDVLGNEVTMYGSESARDFPDYAEKASTKSLGRALLALGYGTAFAPEIDEGVRVVDAPVERTQPPKHEVGANHSINMLANESSHAQQAGGATERQIASIHKLCEALGKPEPEAGLTYNQARELITQLSGEYQKMRRAS